MTGPIADFLDVYLNDYDTFIWIFAVLIGVMLVTSFWGNRD